MTAFPAVIDGEPRGSDGESLLRHMEWDAGEGCPIGRDPRSISVTQLEESGLQRRSPMQVIKAKCLDCCCGSAVEVRRCGMFDCSLWPYRMGADPWRAPVSEEQKERARQNLRRARLSENPPGARGDSDKDEA
jgi:hypothetical protein